MGTRILLTQQRLLYALGGSWFLFMMITLFQARSKVTITEECVQALADTNLALTKKQSDRIAQLEEELARFRQTGPGRPSSTALSTKNNPSEYTVARIWPPSQSEQRPPRRVAVILPHCRKQEDRLRQWFDGLKNFYNQPACDPKNGYANYMDFYFYTNKLHEDSMAGQERKFKEVKQAMLQANVSHCFGSIRTWSANLSDMEDPETYSTFPVAKMFYEVFKTEFIRGYYDYFFYMESDVRPIRPFWIDKIYEEIEFVPDFFQKGPMYQGIALPADYCYNLYCGCGDHMNGNSVYRLGHPIFDEFLKAAERTRPADWCYDAYMINFLRDKGNWRFFQRYAPKFVYTDFIQHRSPLTVANVREKFPNTYLLHQATYHPTEDQEPLLGEDWFGPSWFPHNIINP